ncbi:hypothetical protein A9C19_08215 [Bacillus weihaiensis]|uniref:Uncharacterized protein n=1 Tax=Bacillus weihaiensis TaxID=1547283 RepID=A0A1L3MQW9_9BACI|nr:hypothetical protein A9C19_08215 [Bacillus weihaiensis]
MFQDDTVAIDPTHIEARVRATVKEKQPKAKTKKRGRKSKEEREKGLQEKSEKEASLLIYEKSIEAQLDVSLDDLRCYIASARSF